MNIERRTLGKTYITRFMPWGLNRRHGHRVLCADGIIRACTLAETADTFFSTPASIRVKGKTISGYVTTESHDGLDSGENPVWAFRAHTDTGFTRWPNYDDERASMPDAPSSEVWASYRAKHNAILAKGL